MRFPNAPHSVGLGVGLACGLLFTLAVALSFDPAVSREPDRTLRLYFAHTGEHGTFTFKRNGHYDRAELDKLNHFLRDWRKHEETHMDPHLLDLVWAIYKASGSQDEIHVVSGYRSPQTNAMLRSRSKAVAKHSQHMLGKAMDWFVTDVPLAQLRATAMKMQGGGVGYYPTSGSPFIHTDTGNVRAWPRMTRQQLLALFPNGNTLHLPADGKPLPGYDRALAQLKTSGNATLAYLESGPDESDAAASSDEGGGGVKAWLARVFTGGNNSGTQDNGTQTASSGGEQLVAEADATQGDTETARTPRPRPGAEIAMAAAEPQPAAVSPGDAQTVATLAFAPLPRTRPDPVFLAASLTAGEANEVRLPVASSAFARPAAPTRAAAPAEPATRDPIALAFAAADEAPDLPSKEDSAIIAAFAALHSAAAQKRLALAAASRAEEPSAAPATEARLTLAALTSAPAPAQAADHTVSASAAAAGVVLPPDDVAAYDADRDAIRRLISTPASYDPQFAQLEMPAPGSDTSAVYRAPDKAEVAYLSGEPILPANGFAAPDTKQTSEDRGFFMRLFASLIE